MRVTLSGSFHRHMDKIADAIAEFKELGVEVLSPKSPIIVAEKGEFLFVESDPSRSIKATQDRHFRCISHSDFLWLICPLGYVGNSAAMEIGWASAGGISIYSLDCPFDYDLRRHVTQVLSLRSLVLSLALEKQEALRT
jgi:hypothetical protein